MATMTPWGISQDKEVIFRGLTFHSTASHGGFLVGKKFAERMLSQAARRKGRVYGNYLAYEEDCLANIIYLEIPESRKGITKELTNEELIKSISHWDADYLIDMGIPVYEPGYNFYKERKLEDQMKANKDPNLIVSALKLSGTEVVKVHTADGKTHFVTLESYRLPPGLNLLSRCVLVENFVQTTDLHY